MKPRRSPARRFFVFLVVAFVLYAVLGFVVAPPVLKSQLQKRLPAELGRPVRVESVRINPLILSLTIKGLAIGDRDGGGFVAWDRVYVNFDLVSFLKKEWRFQEITALSPSARVVVNKDGTLNFSDLIEKFSPKPEANEKPAWPLRIAKLVVTGAQLDFADHSHSQEFKTHAGPVNFSLVQFYTAPNRNAPYDFTATTESGEKLRWVGTLSVNPLASEGELEVNGIRPAKYGPYYRDLVPLDVLEGTLDVSGKYKMSLNAGELNARLNNGHMHLTGFKIAPRDSTTPALELNDLELTGVEATMPERSVKVASIALTGGHAAVKRNEAGVIDLLAMLKPPAATSSAPSTPAPATPGTTAPAAALPKVEIATLSVRQFSAVFEDHATPRPAINTVENADLDVQKITLADGAMIPLQATLTLQNRGTVKVDGTVALSPLQADLNVDVANVALAGVSPYVEPMLNVHITDGVISTKGEAHVALPAGQSPDLRYKGALQMDRFGIVDGVANEPVAGWSQLALNGLEFTTAPLALTIDEVLWNDPAAHVIMGSDHTLNLAKILKTAEAPSTAEVKVPPAGGATSPSEKPRIKIAKVTINRGAFTFLDRSVRPEVSTAIKDFGGTISGLSSENVARADVDLKATVDGSGPIAITGKLDPLGEKMAVDLTVAVKDVELTPFSPYSGKFAGFELARGKMFLDVKAKVENEKVDMANLLTLTQFTFGAPTNSPEATKLPVRLAVALLKDTDGKIAIDLPVEGDLKDPSFRIGKVVGRVIVNLLTKAAVSPFSLLGAMFGGGGDELAFQDFAAGSDDLTPDNLKKLETLTKALNGRPALNLEIAGSFDPGTDAQILKQERLAQMVRSRLWDERRAVDADVPPPEQMTVTPADELTMVRKLFVEKFPDAAAQMPAPVVAPPQPIPAPEKPREKKGFFRRATDIVTLKSWREHREEKKEAPAPPPPVVAAPTEVAAGPTLEEMKARLFGTIEITTDDLRRLAARRGQRVRDYFVQQHIPGERLFLANVPTEGKGARVLLQLQ